MDHELDKGHLLEAQCTIRVLQGQLELEREKSIDAVRAIKCAGAVKATLNEVKHHARCGACDDVYTDPVMLVSCGHSFCRRCVHAVYKNAQDPMIGTATCPTCNTPCSGPLTTNYELDQVAWALHTANMELAPLFAP
jgi:hypothetical protein